MYGVLSIDVSITVAVNLMPVLALAKNRELEYPWETAYKGENDRAA